MSYSRPNDFWQNSYRRSLNFDNIWSTSNRSSVSSTGSFQPLQGEWLGVDPGPLDPQAQAQSQGQGPAQNQNMSAQAQAYGINGMNGMSTNGMNQNGMGGNGMSGGSVSAPGMNVFGGAPGPGPRPSTWNDHRHSINSLSPTSEMSDFRWDLNRRHSIGDVMSFDNSNSDTLDSINSYFEADPHKRVKVTVNLLEDNFFNDEKFLNENYQLPKFPTENSLRNYQLVLVSFKAGRIDVFYLPNGSGLNYLKVGDLVIVEADRGKDLGKIAKMNISIDEARLLKFLQFQEQQQALHEDLDEFSFHFKKYQPQNPSSPKSHHQQTQPQPPTLHFPKSILSLAQPNEIVQILNKKQDEEKACRLCLAKISNTNYLNSNNLNDLLNMKLIDSEYQFDRKKLIFYYSTNKRIDFRDLVRELFRIYKTRIWMCAVVGIPYTAGQQMQPLQYQIQQAQQQGPQNQSQIPQSQPQIPQPQPQHQNQPQNQPQNQIPQPQNQQGQIPPQFQFNQYQPFQPQSVPRPFTRTQPEPEAESELFVLKSLVDQINH